MFTSSSSKLSRCGRRFLAAAALGVVLLAAGPLGAAAQDEPECPTVDLSDIGVIAAPCVDPAMACDMDVGCIGAIIGRDLLYPLGALRLFVPDTTANRTFHPTALRPRAYRVLCSSASTLNDSCTALQLVLKRVLIRGRLQAPVPCRRVHRGPAGSLHVHGGSEPGLLHRQVQRYVCRHCRYHSLHPFTVTIMLCAQTVYTYSRFISPALTAPILGVRDIPNAKVQSPYNTGALEAKAAPIEITNGPGHQPVPCMRGPWSPAASRPSRSPPK
mmetsp:Transcript_1940/g.3053  ORF Transcript_1940/g.3053 Transcript_1940/m.3053 type:complete len:272 (+) Transcript_1940:339-1154(+)